MRFSTSVVKFVVIILTITSLAFSKTELRANSNFKVASYRLPVGIIPIHYNLMITPILEDTPGYQLFDAIGTVEITIQAVENGVQEIKLHATQSRITVLAFSHDINVMKPNSNNTLEVVGTSHPAGSDLLTIKMKQELIKAKEYIVRIPFKTKMTIASIRNARDQEGLYISSYDDGPTIKYIATTHFEPSGARKAFPCFDEPALRATFSICVGRLKSYKTLSNGEHSIVVSHPDSRLTNYEVDIFKTTPGLPTYLVAFHVSQYISIPSAYDPQVKVWGPPGYVNQDNARFSADISAKIRQFFTKFFKGNNTEDRMRKLDSVAIPHLPFGAMENWGLNNYQMDYLIFNKENMTQFDLTSQASIIAHEIAHTWFGNLVTLKWWNEIWIKEGLARYLQYVCLEQILPNMKAMDRFSLGVLQVALESDIGANTHAVWRDTLSASNFNIIYGKGGSLVRMMEGFLSGPVLQRGLVAFLEKYKDSSATQRNFMDAVNSVVPAGALLADQTIASIMHSWTTQTGFPLVRISRSDDKRILVSQEKYIPDEVVRNNSRKNTATWDIPITFTTKSEPTLRNFKPKVWIRPNASATFIDVHDANSWILVNPNAMSYYRVLYDANLFTLIVNQLNQNHVVFSAASRAQLIDDYFTFAEHSYSNLISAFELTSYIEAETSLVVWTTFFKHLRPIRSKSTYAEHFQALNTYIGSKIGKIVSKIETNPPPDGNDHPNEWILRALLLDWACKVELPECYSTVRKLLTKWMKNPTLNPIQVDIQRTIYCAAFARLNDEEREFLRSKYSGKNITSNEKELLIMGLTCVREQRILELVVKEVLEIKEIPHAHKNLFLARVAENSIGQDVIFKYLNVSYSALAVTERDEILMSVFATLGNYFSTPGQQQRVKMYLNTRDLSRKVGEVIQNSAKTINQNMKWNLKNSPLLVDWFKKYNSKSIK